MKNEQIAQAFYNGEISRTQNLFIEDINGVKVIFSYGRHFPIGIKFKDGFLFNKNGYSSTTSRHKNLILRYIGNELSEEDFKTTDELNRVIDAIKYNGLKSKAEFIESKI